MARLRPEDIKLSSGPNGAVTLKIKDKTHVIEASDLLRLSTILGNAAVDETKERNRFPVVQDIYLKPFDETGRALLHLQLSAGPVILSIDSNWLKALADAASAALEHSIPAGNG
ncbi:hypothetical protein [Sphingobium sp. MI1205]|uniref:hypothetical protein n=1 Tax=Sphingobium sp. MI1205 TaxID=407020 RepID=UPI00076FE690|nr:hypothetical protein [Sphingobium sp. MI1205]AMK19355.1 hypothetical protein K663_14885 [Sphingobium sp. MI1205]